MNLNIFLSIVSVLLPLITVITAGVSIFLFIKAKSTVDALNQTIATYRGLADGRAEEVSELRLEVGSLKEEIKKLENLLIDTRRNFTCYHMYDCKNFTPLGRVSDDDRGTKYEHI